LTILGGLSVVELQPDCWDCTTAIYMIGICMRWQNGEKSRHAAGGYGVIMAMSTSDHQAPVFCKSVIGTLTLQGIETGWRMFTVGQHHQVEQLARTAYA
jgi:hypothetical protein